VLSFFLKGIVSSFVWENRKGQLPFSRSGENVVYSQGGEGEKMGIKKKKKVEGQKRAALTQQPL